MSAFILRRVLSGIILIFVITIVAFTLLYLGSGNIARTLLGENASKEVVAQKAAELGLDRPLFVQFCDWFGSAVAGNLGRSWFTGQLVSIQLSSRLAVTLSIVIGAIIVTAVFSVVLGIIAARRAGAVDGTIQLISILGFAIPGFLVALFLVLLFAINLHWFKATGYIALTTSVAGWLSSVTLPIAALAIGGTATIAQQVRGSIIDGLSRDYVRTLRSRGLSSNRVVYKHVLRNAGGPALSLLAVQFISTIGAAVIVEQIFALPGIGSLTVQATAQGDIPVVMGIVVVTAIIAVVVNLLIDLAQAALNPKVRLS